MPDISYPNPRNYHEDPHWFAWRLLADLVAELGVTVTGGDFRNAAVELDTALEGVYVYGQVHAVNGIEGTMTADDKKQPAVDQYRRQHDLTMHGKKGRDDA